MRCSPGEPKVGEADVSRANKFSIGWPRGWCHEASSSRGSTRVGTSADTVPANKARAATERIVVVGRRESRIYQAGAQERCGEETRELLNLARDVNVAVNKDINAQQTPDIYIPVSININVFDRTPPLPALTYNPTARGGVWEKLSRLIPHELDVDAITSRDCLRRGDCSHSPRNIAARFQS